MRDCFPGGANRSKTVHEHAGSEQTTSVEPTENPRITAYTLPPGLYRKARNLGEIRFRLALLGIGFDILVLWLLLHLRVAPKYRDWAEALSAKRFRRCLIFAPLLLLTIAVLTLPLEIYSEWISKQYGLSIESWCLWFWDWLKAEFLYTLMGTFAVFGLYSVMRRSPRRWWFYFWLVSIPFTLLVVFVSPWVIDPMFHKFEPLQQKDPALTAALERMVQRAGENIPPDRVFWMQASNKTTGLNAYVAGIGASKRIVVWDTTIAKMTTPQIVYVAGHEMGHYVLLHLPKGLSLFAGLMLVLFYLGFRSVGWVLARWGAGWRIRSLEDWASLPVLLLLLEIFLFAATPILSAGSRYFEHQADQYGSGSNSRSHAGFRPGRSPVFSNSRRGRSRRSRP